MSYDAIKAARLMNPRPVLRRGMEDPAVRLLKRCLAQYELGYDDWGDLGAELSLKFDGGVERFLQEFQGRQGLKTDGICGPKSWGALTLDDRPVLPLERMHPEPSGLLAARMVEAAKYGVSLEIREASNHNDGPLVEEILRRAGGKKGQPWCMAAVWACYQLACRSIDREPLDWPDAAKLSCSALWRAAQAGPGSVGVRNAFGLCTVKPEHVQPGDVGLVKGGSTGHQHAVVATGLLPGNGSVAMPPKVTTAEGNTNNAGSSEGHGLYARTRPVAGLDWVRVS